MGAEAASDTAVANKWRQEHERPEKDAAEAAGEVLAGGIASLFFFPHPHMRVSTSGAGHG